MTEKLMQCLSCKHYLPNVENPAPEEGRIGKTCKAFPGGILLLLFFNEIAHDKTYPGDGGILFEQDSQVEFVIEAKWK